MHSSFSREKPPRNSLHSRFSRQKNFPPLYASVLHYSLNCVNFTHQNRQLLGTSTSLYRSRNPHGTAVFCAVPRNEIFSQRRRGPSTSQHSRHSVSFHNRRLHARHPHILSLNLTLIHL